MRVTDVDESRRPSGGGAAKRPKATWRKWAAYIVVGALLFTAGWAVGGGHLRLRSFASENTHLPSKLDYSSVDQVYALLKQKYDGQLDADTLLDGMKKGLTQATGDPYTEYFNPKDAKDFNEQLSGSFEGIGAELGKDEQNNIIIISPLAGFPAEKAGLKPRDIIAAVDGKSTAEQTISDTVDKIRGPKGTTVTLKVVRGGNPLDVTITREQINIPSVTSKVEGGIGILTVSRFGEDTVGLATKAANDFKGQNVKGVVLDLRGNPGGYLEAAVRVSSLWLDNKTVLTERRGNVIVDTIRSKGSSPLNGVPTVVLINEGSASASEITAGALADNGAAKLVGQKSFGKGSVQEPSDLPNGGLIKITIARWFTPNGKNIDKEGIDPEFKVTLSDDDLKAGRDPQKDKAVQLLNQ